MEKLKKKDLYKILNKKEFLFSPIFFILRNIEIFTEDKFLIGKSPIPKYEKFRINQIFTTNFPYREIYKIKRYFGKKVLIESYLFGLFGVFGPFPICFTEMFYQIYKQKKESYIKNFFLIFHQRLISLLYRVWADSTFYTCFEKKKNFFEFYLSCLLGNLFLKNSKEKKLLHFYYYTGRYFLSFSKNKIDLENILSFFFKIPIKIFENSFSWIKIPNEQKAKISSRVFKKNMYLGNYIPSSCQVVILKFGPMNYKKYLSFFSKKKIYFLKKILNRYSPIYKWKINLVLKKSEYKNASLSKNSNFYLGKNTWIGKNRFEINRKDFFFYV